MDWDKLRIFNAVAEAKSFTHASETLNLSQSAISRQISGLEDSLGITLFHRHARGLVLTEQGEILYSTVCKVFKQLTDVRSQLDDNKENPAGSLRINTTVALGSTWIPNILKDFIQRYPNIDVRLFLSDQELNLQTRQADIGLVVTKPTQSDIIQKPLMDFSLALYASASYIREYGEPNSVTDLDNHKLITYGHYGVTPNTEINWVLTEGRKGEPRRPVLQVNNHYGVYRAVRAGIGIATLPTYVVPDNVGLKRILPELEQDHKITCYFTYHEALRNSKRIRILREFLEEKLRENGLRWKVDMG